jgi:hypothetical protein
MADPQTAAPKATRKRNPNAEKQDRPIGMIYSIVDGKLVVHKASRNGMVLVSAMVAAKNDGTQVELTQVKVE